MLRRALIVAALVSAAVLITAAATFTLTTHQVSGTSMQPTLADGELVVADPTDHRPDRFDVVVLAPGSGPELVKRVIALPGDRVQIVAAGPGGPVVRVLPAEGGRPLEIRLGLGLWRQRSDCCRPDGRDTTRPVMVPVPAGRYFVLGDAPDSSIDSRTFGFTEVRAVRAVVVARLWPTGALPSTPWSAG